MMKKVFTLAILLITAFSVSSQDMLEAMLTDSDETTNIRSTPGGNVVMKLNSGKDDSMKAYVFMLTSPQNGWWKIDDLWNAADDEEEPGYEDEEAYDEDAYEEDASYDESEYEDGAYDESEYEEYDEYDEPEYSEKPVRRSAAPVQQGEGILDKIKGFFSGLIDKLNSDKQLEDYEAAIQAADEAVDRAAQDEYDPDDDDADYDDYDDAADDEEDIHD